MYSFKNSLKFVSQEISDKSQDWSCRMWASSI